MAFVIGKAEKVSVFQPPYQVSIQPGPGEYNSSLIINKNQQCAPFNTSQVKVSTFDVEETKYGPGSYEPKYFKDLNQINKNQCYVFASKVERFQTRQQKSPQRQKQTLTKNKSETLYRQQSDHKNIKPESNNLTTIYSSHSSEKVANRQVYNRKLEKSKSLMSEIREHNRQKRVQSIKGKRQFIRVILTSSTNTQNVESRYIYRDIKGKTLGPGSYQQVNFKPKLKNVMNWNLDKNNRFKTEPSISPGPGAYYVGQIKQQKQTNQNDIKMLKNELLKIKKQKPSAPFASTVIRSHMDSLIYQTNIPIKAAILQDRRLKDSRPGPGTYNLNTKIKDKKSFNYGVDNNFGSSDRVFIQIKQPQPGPGSYNVKNKSKNECNQIIKQIRAQIFGKKGNLGHNYNNNNSLSRSLIYKPSSDPNFSTLQSHLQKKRKRMENFCSLEERCFSRLGTMNQEQRFKQQTYYKEQSLPGPGQYHNQKLASALSNNQSDRRFNSVFKSESDRLAYDSKEKYSDIPYYNIIRNDIGFKAQKMKKYIQNLKKINVNKTPFQIGSKRFEQNISDIGIFRPDQFEKKNPTEFTKYDKNKQQSSSFKSGTKRDVVKIQPNPGPGEYVVQMKNNGAYESIQKKSFNKNYGLNKLGVHSEKKINHSGGYNVISRKNSNAKRQKTIQNVQVKDKNLSHIQISSNDIKIE